MKTARKPESVADYIAAFPRATQKHLKALRSAIRKAAPKATEKISYGMAGYALEGPLVYFAGHANHVGFYALPITNETFAKELSSYKTSKGGIQFPLDRPIPSALVTKMVKFRVKEQLAKAALRKKKQRKLGTKKRLKT